MSAISISIYRRVWTPSVGGRLWTIVIPRGQVLTIERFEGVGLHTAAVTPTRVGIYKVATARNGSGGSPTTTNITASVNDLAQANVTLSSVLPAGDAAASPGSWAVHNGDWTTPPTLDAADLLPGALVVQPFGGADSWPPDGRPLRFHNLQAGEMQIVFAGLTGTGTQADGVEWRLQALAGV